MISFSVIKPKIIYQYKSTASKPINLFVNLSMTADSDYYANKLYKLRQVPKETRGPGVGLPSTPW